MKHEYPEISHCIWYFKLQQYCNYGSNRGQSLVIVAKGHLGRRVRWEKKDPFVVNCEDFSCIWERGKTCYNKREFDNFVVSISAYFQKVHAFIRYQCHEWWKPYIYCFQLKFLDGKI